MEPTESEVSHIRTTPRALPHHTSVLRLARWRNFHRAFFHLIALLTAFHSAYPPPLAGGIARENEGVKQHDFSAAYPFGFICCSFHLSTLFRFGRGLALGPYKVSSFYIGINVLGLHIPIEITIHLTESAGLQDCQQSIFVQKKLDMG